MEKTDFIDVDENKFMTKYSGKNLEYLLKFKSYPQEEIDEFIVNVIQKEYPDLDLKCIMNNQPKEFYVSVPYDLTDKTIIDIATELQIWLCKNSEIKVTENVQFDIIPDVYHEVVKIKFPGIITKSYDDHTNLLKKYFAKCSKKSKIMLVNNLEEKLIIKNKREYFCNDQYFKNLNKAQNIETFPNAYDTVSQKFADFDSKNKDKNIIIIENLNITTDIFDKTQIVKALEVIKKNPLDSINVLNININPTNKLYIDDAGSNDNICSDVKLPKNLINTQLEGCIYLMRTREFIRLNEPTYKIGKTRQKGLKRFSCYPKKSELIGMYKSYNLDDDEKYLIAMFKSHYRQMKIYGREYFWVF